MHTLIKENKELAWQLIEAKNENDPSKIRALLAPDFIAYIADLHEPINAEEYIKQVNLAHRAFKPLILTIEEIIAEKDMVAVRVLTKGKHTGVYEFFKATNNEICFCSIFMKEIKNRKISKVWQVSDHLTMMKQIGLSVNHII